MAGPTRIKSGDEATFQVEVSFNGEPYALEYIQEVKFIVLDATGQVALSGYGTPVVDGLFEITLSAEDTAKLPTGSNRIEAIVLPTLVAAASFDAHTFVTLP